MKKRLNISTRGVILVAVIAATTPLLSLATWSRLSTHSHSSTLASRLLPCVLGAIPVLISLWLLLRRIAHPLAAIAADLGADPALPPLQGNELTRIRAAIRELRGQLEDSRATITRMERVADSRLAKQSRDMAADITRLQNEAWMDPLTGARNRRLMAARFPGIFLGQQARNSDLAVVMLDVDHLKTVNDRLGHPVGDRLIAFAGELLRQCVRPGDIVVRYGGDEFLLILPGMAAHQARGLADRLIAMFIQRAKMIAEVQPAPALTAGVSGLRENQPAGPQQMIQFADEALYAAKKAGKRHARVHGLDHVAA